MKNVIGIFGLICSGKSSFSKLLAKELNALYIDADIIGHEALNDKIKKEELIKLSEKAGMSLSMYLIEQGLDKDIIIIEGIEKFEAELRKIGNNINQLTRWANYGYLKVVSLDEVKKELGKIWNELLDVFNYYKY